MRPPLIELLLTGDWVRPLRLSLLAAAIGLLLITVIVAIAASSVLLVGAQMDDSLGALTSTTGDPGFGEVARGTAFAVLTMWAGAHGAFGMTVVTATSCLWIVLSFVLANRTTKLGPRDRTEILVTAIKSGVVYAGLALAATLFLRATTVTSLAELIGGGPLSGGVGSFGSMISPFSDVVKPFVVIVGGLVLGFVGSAIALARQARLSLLEVVGMRRPSQLVSAAIRGGREGMVMLVLTALIVVVIGGGTAMGLSGTEAGVDAGDVAGVGLAMLPLALAFLLAFGIDLGLALGVFAMQFFSLSSYLPAGLGGAPRIPAWIYIGLLVPAIAAYRGGMVAAEHANARDRSEAARAGAATAITAAALMLIWSLMFFTRVGGKFVFTATALTLVWFAVFGTIGGFTHGRRAGLPERSMPHPAPTSALTMDRPSFTTTIAPPVPPVPAAPPVPAPAPPPAPVPAPPRPPQPPQPAISELDTIGISSATLVQPAFTDTRPVEAHPTTASVEPETLEDNVQCASCGDNNPATSKFCGSCGTSIVMSHVCDGCGAVQPIELRFCRECGTQLGQRR